MTTTEGSDPPGGQGGQRSTRQTNLSADQVPSTAQTLLSTSPVERTVFRMAWSLRSVASPEDFFGQAIQRPPDGKTIDPRRSRRCSSSAWPGDEGENDIGGAPRPYLTATPGGRSRSTSPEAPTMATLEPSLMPSFAARGVPEYPAVPDRELVGEGGTEFADQYRRRLPEP